MQVGTSILKVHVDLKMRYKRNYGFALAHWQNRISIHKEKAPSSFELRAFVKWRRPTLPRVCSTIGAVGLNFSVRNGKRWNPVAITTGNIVWTYNNLCVAEISQVEVARVTSCSSASSSTWYSRYSSFLERKEINVAALSVFHLKEWKFRAISSARLWRHRLYTYTLSTS